MVGWRGNRIPLWCDSALVRWARFTVGIFVSDSKSQFAWLRQFARVGQLARAVPLCGGSVVAWWHRFRLAPGASQFRRLTVFCLLIAILAAFGSGLCGLQLVSEQAASELLLKESTPNSAEAKWDFDADLKCYLGQGFSSALCSGDVARLLHHASGFCCRRLLCLCSRGPPPRC